MKHGRKMMGIGIGAVALAAMLVSFTGNNDDEKKKRYQIIHQENGEVVEYDTLIPMSSIYTVNDFLADKGIDAENVEIIDVPSMAGHKMMFAEEHSRFIQDMEMNGEGENVMITIEMDDEGNMTTKKVVNGEEVEMTEEELEELKMHKEEHMHGKHGEHIMIKEFSHDFEVEVGEGEEVKIIVEMDDDGNMTTKKFVDGEEVEMTDEELKELKMHKEEHMLEHGKHGEHVIIKEFSHDVEVDGEGEEVKIIVEMDDDGNMTTKKFVDGEEVEMTDEELKELKMHKEEHMLEHGKHGEHVIIKEFSHDVEVDGEGEEVKIIVEMDDDGNMTTKKFVNGEEVEVTEEEMEKMKIHKEMSGDHMMIRIDSEELGEEELEKVMKELKIELKDLEGEMEEMQIEINEIFGEGENVFIIKNGDHQSWTSKGEGEDFTLVIVTKDIDPSEISKRSDVKVDHVVESKEVSIYPNPSDGVFTIQLNQTEKVKTLIKISDAQGKLVFKDNLGKFSGEYREEVDLKKYGAGTYIINIEQGDKVITEKVVVK